MSKRPALWQHIEFRRGARDMTGVALGIGAWGLVTGVAMSNSAMGPGLAAVMSLLVFSGTAQLAVLPLMASGAPIWVLWATAACLNLRFVIFSAQCRPYFGNLPLRQRVAVSYFCADLNVVLLMRRFPQPRPDPDLLPYFWGGVLINAGSWQLCSLTGIVLARHVPGHWGLGFAGTLALLGLVYSMLADRATWLPALLAGCAAVAAYALPLKLNIVVAVAAAVAMGLIVDRVRPPRGAAGA